MTYGFASEPIPRGKRFACDCTDIKILVETLRIVFDVLLIKPKDCSVLVIEDIYLLNDVRIAVFATLRNTFQVCNA